MLLLAYPISTEFAKLAASRSRQTVLGLYQGAFMKTPLITGLSLLVAAVQRPLKRIAAPGILSNQLRHRKS